MNREKHKNIDTEADSEDRSGYRSGREKDAGTDGDSGFNTGKGADANTNRRPGAGISRKTNNFSDTNRDTNMENTPARKFTNIYTNRNTGKSVNEESESDKQSDKKIVSYYLDKELINRLKNLADDQNSYYSAVVSAAIRHWVEKHGF